MSQKAAFFVDQTFSDFDKVTIFTPKEISHEMSEEETKFYPDPAGKRFEDQSML